VEDRPAGVGRQSDRAAILLQSGVGQRLPTPDCNFDRVEICCPTLSDTQENPSPHEAGKCQMPCYSSSDSVGWCRSTLSDEAWQGL
uniref:Uncharacterized protein n=1 Tax=Romanomermis culicivorax TaxID=13658 RepID=A0A915J7P4_ROMCU